MPLSAVALLWSISCISLHGMTNSWKCALIWLSLSRILTLFVVAIEIIVVGTYSSKLLTQIWSYPFSCTSWWQSMQHRCACHQRISHSNDLSRYLPFSRTGEKRVLRIKASKIWLHYAMVLGYHRGCFHSSVFFLRDRCSTKWPVCRLQSWPNRGSGVNIRGHFWFSCVYIYIPTCAVSRRKSDGPACDAEGVLHSFECRACVQNSSANRTTIFLVGSQDPWVDVLPFILTFLNSSIMLLLVFLWTFDFSSFVQVAMLLQCRAAAYLAIAVFYNIMACRVFRLLRLVVPSTLDSVPNTDVSNLRFRHFWRGDESTYRETRTEL